MGTRGSTVCVIHLLSKTIRYASRKCWDQIAKDIKPVYTAPKETAARERFAEFSAKWGGQYPAIIKLWENAWTEFIPFLDYDVEIYARSSARPMLLSPSTLAIAGQFGLEGISRPSRPRSNVCTWSPDRSTHRPR